jgi:predicted ATP-grasp superfamily ATP-dependent carboligase
MDSRTVVIVAASGRALAASARRAGYAPLIVDWFGDADTLAYAEAHARVDGLAHGFKRASLDAALAKVIGEREPCGLVCGTGFEDRPALMDHMAQLLPIPGNVAATIAALKDPQAFASLCRDCGIAHPEVTFTRPVDAQGWLAKRIGGAGGSHIRIATEHTARRGYYHQRAVAGVAISAQFLADGTRALVVGFSEQWAAPTERQPFRYGGAARPAHLAQETADALADAVQRIAAASRLAGLNSADFLVGEHGFWLLEVNPRPSATLDIFEPPGGSLFALHMSACDGALHSQALHLTGAGATAIVYAERDTTIPPLVWPEWTADRPHAGTAVKTGEPLCTVLAFAATATEARQLVENRRASVLTWTHASSR